MIVLARPLFSPSFRHPAWSGCALECPSECDRNENDTKKQDYEELTDDEVSIYLPGVGLDDLEVKVDSTDPNSSLLSVKGERKRAAGGSYIYSKIWSLNPTVANVEEIKAHLVDGVLTLSIPRKERASKTRECPSECDRNENDTKKQDYEELTDDVKVSIDLPGVGLDDLEVKVDSTDPNSSLLTVKGERKRASGGSLTYSREWSLNPTVANVEEIKAHLVDGVLTLSIPRKQRASKTLNVSSEEPPEFDEEKTLSASFDFPGLNAESVTVLYKNGILRVSGDRKSGSNLTSVHRSFPLDERRLVVDSLKAYLIDGVFTLRATRAKPNGGAISTVSVSNKTPILEEEKKSLGTTLTEEEIVVDTTGENADKGTSDKKEWVDVETVQEED